MKQVSFKEVNHKDENSQPICLAQYQDSDGNKTIHSISKFIFNKDEVRFIREYKHLWVIQNMGQHPPLFGFISPFGNEVKGFKPIDLGLFINHQLNWQDHNFMVLLDRNYNNTKAKVHWFSITMDGDWVKSGNLPETLQSDGKGWLRSILSTMIEEYEAMMVKAKNQEKKRHVNDI